MKRREHKLAARGIERARRRAVDGPGPRINPGKRSCRVTDNTGLSGPAAAPVERVRPQEPEKYTTAEERSGLQLGTALKLALIPFVVFALGMALWAK